MSLPSAASRLAVLAAALSVPGLAFAQDAPPAEEEQALPVEEEAQPAPEEAEPAAGSVAPAQLVVTATKREQALSKVPIAVSVVEAAAIELAAVRDLKDLATLVPALRISQLHSPAQTGFTIRGFGDQANSHGGAYNPGIEPAVGVFVDGVYRSRSAAQISDLPEVSRVEVLRGPQSTLFGKHGSAGVVALVTREPQFQFGGGVEAGYGNFNALTLKGHVTGPLSGKLAASLSAGINQRDGYVTDLGTGGRSNERDRWFVRGQMLFEPSEVLRFRLIADYDRIDEVCCAAINLQGSAATAAIETLGGRVSDFRAPFADLAWSNFASANRIDNWGVSGQAEYRVGPLTVTSITAWRESRSRTAQDSDFSSAALIGANSGDVSIGTFTQELRFNAGFLDVFQAVLGGFLFDEQLRYDNTLRYGPQFRGYADLISGGGISALEATFPALPAGTFFRAGQGATDRFRMHNSALSAFGTFDFRVLERFTFTIGANYTRDAKTVVSDSVGTDAFSALDLAALGPAAVALRPYQFLPPFRNFPNAVESGKTRDGDWSWTARLATDLNAQLRTYFSYSGGFKASSFNLSRESRPSAADLTRLGTAGLLVPNLTAGSRSADLEDSRVFEFGIKADWGNASASLAVFDQAISGFQANVFTGTGFTLANAGKLKTRGVEFDGQVRPVPAVQLSLAMVYLDPSYDSFPASALGDLSGTRPAGIPELAATFGVQWSHAMASGDRLIARGDFHYESPVHVVDGLPGFVQRNAAGTVVSYQPAFDAARPFRREVSELNASLTWVMPSGFELSLWGRNLIDDRYLVSIFETVIQPGAIFGHVNQPRTFGASARFKW